MAHGGQKTRLGVIGFHSLFGHRSFGVIKDNREGFNQVSVAVKLSGGGHQNNDRLAILTGEPALDIVGAFPFFQVLKGLGHDCAIIVSSSKFRDLPANDVIWAMPEFPGPEATDLRQLHLAVHRMHEDGRVGIKEVKLIL